jgi:uncharacterized protein
MKNLLAIIAVSCILCVPCVAQQNPADAPATQADVEKYLEVMHSHEMMLQMVDAMAKPMQKMMHEEYMKDKDSLPPDFEERMNKAMNDMLREMPWDQILQAMVPAYQKHFTKGDMDALVAFYSTPTGQKVLREMPGLMADSMDTMMPVIRQHVEKVSQRMQDELVAMMKESQKPPASRPASHK